jgi:multiple sugar transport system permease protein
MQYPGSSTPAPTQKKVSLEPAQQTVKPTVSRNRLRTTLAFWGFVGPLLLGLLFFFFIPILWSVVLSFSNARSTLTPQSFAGLSNYQHMLSDPDFLHALGTFIIFAIFIVPLTFILAWSGIAGQ